MTIPRRRRSRACAVVDLTSYIAGSYGAMMLADMGASVIKVEALEGDSFRELPGFFGWNRGKRSIAMNLKEPDGLAIVHRLAARPTWRWTTCGPAWPSGSASATRRWPRSIRG